jgi:hypothetical protein
MSRPCRWLAGHASTPPDDILLDFSIDIGSIPSIGFADVLRGTSDPELIQDARCWSGRWPPSSAIDQRSRHRALPGPFVQALAFETLAQERHSRPFAAGRRRLARCS